MFVIRGIQDIPDVCAYCGCSPATTREHVLPKGLKLRSELGHPPILVRACVACNRRKAPLDEQCRNLLALHQANQESGIARELCDKEVIRSVRRLRELDRMSPTRHLVEVAAEKSGYFDADGQFVRGQVVDNLPFHDWLSLLVQGIAMNSYRRYFGAFDCSVRVQSPADFRAMLDQPVFSKNCVHLGSHTIVVHVSFPEIQPMGLYSFQFFEGIGFSVFAATSEILPELLAAFGVPRDNRTGPQVLHVSREGVICKPCPH